MKVYAVGWSDELDDIGQWVLDRRCYASEADAMKRKERIEGRGDVRRYTHIEKLELMDSDAFVTRDAYELACAERDMWRGIVGSMLDAADEIRRIADAAMPRGAAALVDLDGEVVG